MADALAWVAQTLEYEVVRVVIEQERRDLEDSPVRVVELDELAKYLAAKLEGRPPQLAAVVASQGHYDEPALEALLAVPALYIGLLASRKRGATVRELLHDRGISEAALSAIRTPAGLDLGATSPGEVAVSILAEIIQLKSAAESGETRERPYALPAANPPAIDPVCGMEVEIATAMHRSVFAEQPYYFCCLHCKTSFDADPARCLERAGIA